MSNENGIELNMDNGEFTPIQMMSRGFEQSGTPIDEESAHFGTPGMELEIQKRISAGNYENIDPVSMISYGMTQQADTAERKRNSRRENRRNSAKKQQEAIDRQNESLFGETDRGVF